MNSKSKWQTVGAIVLSAAVAHVCWAHSAAPGQATGASIQPPAAAGDAGARFKAAGKGAGLTVLPMRLAGKSFPKAGEVVAMMLERGGMTNLETSAVEFVPPENAELGAEAKAFGEFVRAHPTPTEYALFTEVVGTREAGMSEVRAMVASVKGEVVWQDRQAKGDADFDRIGPREPLQCCVLIAERLRPVLGLGDAGAENAPAGKIAERFRKDAGVPDKAEMAAIEKRGEAFKKAGAGATLTVYPSHAGAEFAAQSAKDIAAAVNEKRLMKATASDKGPRPEIAPDANEQKMLWAMARACGAYVKKNPPATDYVLFADYLMGKDFVGGVHFAICNRAGELVVVDYQNDHHADFQTIGPKTREDCDRLLVERLRGYCQ
jgi:hypothetical protein